MASSIETTDTTTTLKNNGNTYLSVDTNDVVALANVLPIASGGTGSDDGAIYLQTAVASTSGATIDFTSIPAGVKRISIHLVGVSTSGGSDYLIQLGDAGGIETSGYLGSSGRLVTGTNGLRYTAGFGINNGAQAAGYITHGSMVCSLVKASTFTWVANGVFGGSDSYTNTVSGGSKSTSATLDRVRLTTVNGSDTFDAGLVTISWEF